MLNSVSLTVLGGIESGVGQRQHRAALPPDNKVLKVVNQRSQQQIFYCYFQVHGIAHKRVTANQGATTNQVVTANKATLPNKGILTKKITTMATNLVTMVTQDSSRQATIIDR